MSALLRISPGVCASKPSRYEPISSWILLTLCISDFFGPQKEAADIYFLRWIFHNWSNKYSIKILQALVPAMRPGSKLVINDYLLPEPNTLPPGLEKAIRCVNCRFVTISS